ncbi:Rho GTPase activation protein, partial [Lactarius psammicola]
CSDNRVVVWKKSKNQTGKRIGEDLETSATKYADYAENTISKLQQEYLKRYHPRFSGQREILQDPQPAKSEEGFDDSCRAAVTELNNFRSMRVENLGDGYDCLEELVFTPTVKDVLVKYMDGMTTACAKYNNLAMSTRAEVEKALAGTDKSDLRAAFRRALSYSIPPPTLYRNYRSGVYSDLIFGVPLVDVEINEDNVPKVMGMCIEEIEKRGLDTRGIYLVARPFNAEVPQASELRRRVESEKLFSFSSTDNIHSVAMLLKRYLLDLPEPLFMLSLQDYRNYTENRARYTKNDFSLLRSKIEELHPVQRASLGALMRHLSRVTSHSDKNAITVEVLAVLFRYPILRGNYVYQDGVHVKTLVMEDLIRHARTLFDERPSPSPTVPPPHVTEATSTLTSGSFLSPELSQSPEGQAMSPTTRYHPGLVGGIPTSTQSSLSSLPSDASMESHLAPSLTPLLSPLQGLPSSQSLLEGLTGGVETTRQEQVIPEARSTQAVETLINSTLAEGVSGDDPAEPTRERAIDYVGFSPLLRYELAH